MSACSTHLTLLASIPLTQVAAEALSPRYAADLQDPAASAVLAADAAVVITASPTFMAKPWLEKYLGVPASNVYGADLLERNGRCARQPAPRSSQRLHQRARVANSH